SGKQVLAPGPGHGARDRSLSVALSATSPDGFVTHSFSGDDWRECRDHVRNRLGLPRDNWKRERQSTRAPKPTPRSDDGDAEAKRAKAINRWTEANGSLSLVRTYLAGRGLDLPDDIAREV